MSVKIPEMLPLVEHGENNPPGRKDEKASFPNFLLSCLLLSAFCLAYGNGSAELPSED